MTMIGLTPRTALLIATTIAVLLPVSAQAQIVRDHRSDSDSAGRRPKPFYCKSRDHHGGGNAGCSARWTSAAPWQVRDQRRGRTEGRR